MINKIGIIVTCLNEVAYTKAAVASIKTSHPYELIIIDDYSIDGTKAWLKTLTNVTTIVDPDTESLGEKWNLGAAKARDLGCDVILIANNDILFHPYTIDNLVARLNFAQDNQENVVMVSANNQRGHIKPEEIFTLSILPQVSEAEHPDFSCFLINLKALAVVGGFSTDYKPCYFEDNDFHTMLKLHGLKAIAITSAPYYHYGSVTQNSVEGGLCKGPQFEHNRAIYVTKFGATPDEIDIEKLRIVLNIRPITSIASIL